MGLTSTPRKKICQHTFLNFYTKLKNFCLWSSWLKLCKLSHELLTNMCWLKTHIMPSTTVSAGPRKRPPFLKASPIAYIPEAMFPFKRCAKVSRYL